MKNFNQTDDLNLVALLYQYGRYLLISSSQPGGQAANLQGVWNASMGAPWDSKYTININAEMNYWPAEVANLSECHEPLFSLASDLATTGPCNRLPVSSSPTRQPAQRPHARYTEQKVGWLTTTPTFGE